MKEIIPGVFHWTRQHPKIGIEVSSYFLAGERVLLDPLVPESGLEGFPGKPAHVVLTNRHHFRESDAFRERFGCEVWCVEQGMHEFRDEDRVHPYRFGDDLPGGIVALEVGQICPDETALLVAREGGILALADGVVRDGDGPLSFVPDSLLGDDPDGVKRGLAKAYGEIARRHEFEHLLLAHGNPLVGSARKALREFAGV